MRALEEGIEILGATIKIEKTHMRDCHYICRASAEGYQLFDVGSFPAAKPGKGIVKGELFAAPVSAIDNLDYLEGEGSLYKRKCIQVDTKKDGKVFALFYEFLGDTEGMMRIPEECQPYRPDWNTKH